MKLPNQMKLPDNLCGCQAGGLCTDMSRRFADADNRICVVQWARKREYDPNDMDNYRVLDLAKSRVLLQETSDDPLRTTLEQRGKQYGDYAGMCNKVQTIKNVFKDTKTLEPFQREALEMIATKIGRIINGNPNNEDSWRDIAGYATLVADCISKRDTAA